MATPATTKAKAEPGSRNNKSKTAIASAPKHEQLGLNKEQLKEMYYYMLLARSLDERMWLLNRQGKAPFVISCQGHEAIQVGTAFAMERGKDWFLPYYRDLALCVALGMTPREVMLQHFAKRDEPNSDGRRMTGGCGDRRVTMVTRASTVAKQMCDAVGGALASKVRKTGEVTVVAVGESAAMFSDSCQ